jgi:hypothetical protein
MLKLWLQTFQLCTDMTHNAIPFHVVVMKVEQPPQQSTGNESIWVNSRCMRVLHEKINLEMLIVDINLLSTKCFSSKTKHQTYCACSPGVLQCDECDAQHVFDAKIGTANLGLNPVTQKIGKMGTLHLLVS